MANEFRGTVSPRAELTLQGEARRKAGIPLHAESFAFAYPAELPKIDKKDLNFDRHPWMYFVAVGGWLYFDKDDKLIQVKASCPNKDDKLIQVKAPFHHSGLTSGTRHFGKLTRMYTATHH